jgi:hypothetical protein
MASTDELVALLRQVLQDRFRRKELIFRFQEMVNNAPPLAPEDEATEILGDLAWDLSFYVQKPQTRREDPAYYGDERLEEEIREALRKLGRDDTAEGT